MSAITPKDINSVTPEELAEILNGQPERAAAWMRAAAEGGIAQAQLVYGQMLLDGKGMPRDPEQAVFWFKRAAKDNHPMAMNMLGQCHQHGWGVPTSPVMATYWFRLSAQAGLDWGMYNYATALTLGTGIEQNRAQAFVWLQRAAAMGHAKSINIVGGFFEDGWEVEADIDQAIDHYRRAAEGGDFRGQFNYARLLAERGFVDQALEWLEKIPATATTAFMEKTRDFLLKSELPAFQQKSQWFQARLDRRLGKLQADD